MAEQQVQEMLDQVQNQLLQEQIRKTCFGKCFQGSDFPSGMTKNHKICLAKCMDRMTEARQIVQTAMTQVGQQQQQQMQQQGGFGGF